MEQETYNGWTNRETWAVYVNWSNNKCDYQLMTETASKLTLHELAEFMKDDADQILQRVLDKEANEASCRFIADVGSLDRVNWEEVARAFKGEVNEGVSA